MLMRLGIVMYDILCIRPFHQRTVKWLVNSKVTHDFCILQVVKKDLQVPLWGLRLCVMLSWWRSKPDKF